MLDEAQARRASACSRISLRRRSLLQAQIEALRAGRDSLLDAYRVVKRSFLEATDALAQVEARAAAERAAHEHDTYDGERGDELADTSGALAAGDIDTDVVDAAVEAAAAADAEHAEPRRRRRRRCRPRRRRLAVRPHSRRARSRPTIEPAAAPSRRRPSPRPRRGRAAAEAEPRTDAEAGRRARAAPSEPAPDARRRVAARRRASVLDPLLVAVAKRAKRAAQDDQNALLDAVRRHKGRPTAAQVLVPEADLLHGVGRGAAGGARRGLRRRSRRGRR